MVKCTQCGSTFHLMVHHKDGNPLNNSEENLEVLCKSCNVKKGNIHITTVKRIHIAVADGKFRRLSVYKNAFGDTWERFLVDRYLSILKYYIKEHPENKKGFPQSE